MVPLMPARPDGPPVIDGREVVYVEPTVSVVVLIPALAVSSTPDEVASLWPVEAATVVVPLTSVAVAVAAVPLALEAP